MDITQIVSLISLLAVTVIVVVVGVWATIVLKELKTTIIQVNQILSDTKLITSSVAAPVSSFSEFLMGFKNGFSIFNRLVGKKHES